MKAQDSYFRTHHIPWASDVRARRYFLLKLKISKFKHLILGNFDWENVQERCILAMSFLCEMNSDVSSFRETTNQLIRTWIDDIHPHWLKPANSYFPQTESEWTRFSAFYPQMESRSEHDLKFKNSTDILTSSSRVLRDKLIIFLFLLVPMPSNIKRNANARPFHHSTSITL